MVLILHFTMMVNKIEAKHDSYGSWHYLYICRGMMVNKIDRPSTTPTVRGICAFAIYFVLSRSLSYSQQE